MFVYLYICIFWPLESSTFQSWNWFPDRFGPSDRRPFNPWALQSHGSFNPIEPFNPSILSNRPGGMREAFKLILIICTLSYLADNAGKRGHGMDGACTLLFLTAWRIGKLKKCSVICTFHFLEDAWRTLRNSPGLLAHWRVRSLNLKP